MKRRVSLFKNDLITLKTLIQFHQREVTVCWNSSL